MTRQARREGALPLFLISDEQEWIPDLRPRPDGVRFVRGILLGIALSCPFGLWFAGLSSFTKKPISCLPFHALAPGVYRLPVPAPTASYKNRNRLHFSSYAPAVFA